MRHGVDLWNNLIHRIISYNRKDRTKNLLLHHRIIKGDRVKNRWLNAKRIRIGSSAIGYFSGGDQITESVKMLFIDDFSIIWILKRCFRILPADLPDQMLYKTILDLAVTIDVIRSDTGLAAVKKFSKNNPAAASFRLHLRSTIQGLLPPSSRVTGVRN